MKTKITELLQIEYPVFQGGMAWVAEHKLAAAVSNAGGLGIIGAASAPPEVVREEIRKCKELTDKPFGVNIMLLNPNAEDVAKIVVEEGVKAVTTGAGNPGKFMELWKNAGVKVIPVVASVAMAKMMERAGADAVVAEGMESGGHIGSTTTMALVPQVVDAVSIPVIAAGGIADGRGMAAAFMLGAEGIQMGTRFVASKESIVHENYKNHHSADNHRSCHPVYDHRILHPVCSHSSHHNSHLCIPAGSPHISHHNNHRMHHHFRILHNKCCYPCFLFWHLTQTYKPRKSLTEIMRLYS